MLQIPPESGEDCLENQVLIKTIFPQIRIQQALFFEKLPHHSINWFLKNYQPEKLKPPVKKLKINPLKDELKYPTLPAQKLKLKIHQKLGQKLKLIRSKHTFVKSSLKSIQPILLYSLTSSPQPAAENIEQVLDKYLEIRMKRHANQIRQHTFSTFLSNKREMDNINEYEFIDMESVADENTENQLREHNESCNSLSSLEIETVKVNPR